jgi:Fe-S-cluster-containing hydrogenase component 2
MPGKKALVNYNKCEPERCDGGICTAALACSRKVLTQEAPYEIPMTDPSPCKGCSDCALACPLKAIEMAQM